MKRTFATITLAVCVSGMSACDRAKAVDPTKLIPDSATVVGGVDVRAVLATKTWAANKDKLESEAKAQLEDVTACKVGPETWKSIVFGLDPVAAESKVVLVASVDGLGKKETLDCLAAKYKEKNGGKDVWTTGEQDGRTTIAIPEGEFTGYVVDDDTIVFAGKEWTEATRKLIAGEGKAAVDGSLKDVLAKVKQDHVWAAGLWPESVGTPHPLLAGVKFASFALNVSDGIGVSASVAYANAEDAKTKADQVNEQWNGLKSFVTAYAPQGLVDSVAIKAEADTVSVSATLSQDDIDTLAKKANLGGASAAAEPPAAPEAE